MIRIARLMWSRNFSSGHRPVKPARTALVSKEVIVDRDGGRPVIEKAGHGHAEIRCRLDREDERPLTYGRAISRAVRPTVTSRRVSPPPGGPPQGRRGP